ncbi:MAG: response regulator [Bacteroidales bacterium]|nr:response regulator [Bacteroidales bacterium]
MNTPRILVIDDEKELREEIIDILRFEGYETLEAKNGKEGIEKAKRHRPDLILCDILMPIMDGISVYKNLTKDISFLFTPFIFLTALAEKEKIREGMILGVDDYITKPFQKEKLLEAIKIRLQKSNHFIQETSKKNDQLRNNILKHLPHELRTPLNGIVAFGPTLKDYSDTLTPNELKEIGSILELSGNRLIHIIEKYIFYLQLLARPEKEYTGPLLTQIPDTVSCVANAIAKKNERSDDLVLRIKDAYAKIEFEEFNILLKELIENAFNFSEKGTPVTIEGELDRNLYLFSISDEGVGFPKEEVNSIEAFMQFNRTEQEQQGLGLGLATVKKIVESHSGRLVIDTTVEKGTHIIVSIPANKA